MDKIIIDFAKKVKNNYNIQKIFLFGSRARGDYLKNSDYDVIIVSHDFEGVFFTKRISEIYKFWNGYPLDIEPLCYTPEEFEKKSKQIGIVQQALKEGIEI